MKERSPGTPTLYAGYTNELLGYLPTAAEYQFGGYEAGYGYKSVGLPSLFDPSVEEILVSTGVRLAERLFPEAEPWDAGRGWTARGAERDRARDRAVRAPVPRPRGVALVTARIGVIGAGFWAVVSLPAVLPRAPGRRARRGRPEDRGRPRCTSSASSGSRSRRPRSTSCSPQASTASSSPRRTLSTASTRSRRSRPAPTCSSRSR